MLFEIESKTDGTRDAARVDILPAIDESLVQLVTDDADEATRSFEQAFLCPIFMPSTSTTIGPDIAERSVETIPASGFNETFRASGHNETKFDTDKTTIVDTFLDGKVFAATSESETHTEEPQDVVPTRFFTDLSQVPKPPDKNDM